jgi:hypothetical protein
MLLCQACCTAKDSTFMQLCTLCQLLSKTHLAQRPCQTSWPIPPHSAAAGGLKHQKYCCSCVNQRYLHLHSSTAGQQVPVLKASAAVLAGKCCCGVLLLLWGLLLWVLIAYNILDHTCEQWESLSAHVQPSALLLWAQGVGQLCCWPQQEQVPGTKHVCSCVQQTFCSRSAT